MYMTTLISKTTLPFYHEWERVSNSSSHLSITRRASTIVLISIITTGAIITLILKRRWRWRRESSETTHGNLSSCNTTNTGVHLTQLITENVKVSIHVHKLCHDVLKSHPTRRRRWSKGGWSWRSQRNRRPGLCPPQSKFHLALFNSSSVYSTHDRKVVWLSIEERKVANDLHDSRRKNELIIGCRIPIDMCSKRDNKKWTRGSVIEL